MTDLNSLASLGPQFGLAAFAIFILWKMAIMFVNREKEKDIAHAQERKEWAQRMDKKDEKMGLLESDIRTNFATSLAENSNVVKQALAYMARRAKKGT